MLKIISEQNLQRENEILLELFNSIDSKESTIMNSGAGSGKTYALVESLKYCIKKYGKILRQNNQKIMCITFTNVAANEIKNRLGNSNIIEISTIHDRIWEIIKLYQKELIQVHREKLSDEVSKLTETLESDKMPNNYLDLSYELKSDLKEALLSNKANFYDAYDKGAKYFKIAISSFLNLHSDLSDSLLKNVGKFKSLANTIYKIDRYTKCLNCIDEGIEGYQEVLYYPIYNNDILDKMIISHDTLLEYGKQLICKYDTLKKIVIDRYPYIFIDEYQDTIENVVQIINHIDIYSKANEHKIFIGYFGDSAQNIYEEGVGAKLFDIHENCNKVNKEFNRRSYKEIIDISNKIRNDDIQQISIYSDCQGGSVEVFKGDEADINSFLNEIATELNIDKNNKLHCLLLTNKLVAKYMEIENFYNSFSMSYYYKKNFNQLSSELLSNDIKKLGRIPALIYNVVDLYLKLNNDKTLVLEIFKKSEISKLTIAGLQTCMEEIRSINGSTLLELFTSICNTYDSSTSEICKSTTKNIIGLETISISEIKRYIMDSLYPNPKDKNIETVKNCINNFLNLSIVECKKWYNYISLKSNDSIIYQTFHNTKGLEYNNVVIIMENDFGINKNFFKNYFENVKNNSIPNGESSQNLYEAAKNLLYVSVTRAIKNLRILYIGQISEDTEDGIKKIFGEIKFYKGQQ